MNSDTANRQVVAGRLINAPRDRVFKAWTDPMEVAQWWGPEGFTNTIEKMEVKPGGTWKLMMHGPDGANYKNKSVFVEVVKPSRLVYLHVTGPKFQMTVTFDEVHSKTRICTQMLFETVEEYSQAVNVFSIEAGAIQTLDRLENFLKKNEGIEHIRCFFPFIY